MLNNRHWASRLPLCDGEAIYVKRRVPAAKKRSATRRRDNGKQSLLAAPSGYARELEHPRPLFRALMSRDDFHCRSFVVLPSGPDIGLSENGTGSTSLAGRSSERKHHLQHCREVVLVIVSAGDWGIGVYG